MSASDKGQWDSSDIGHCNQFLNTSPLPSNKFFSCEKLPLIFKGSFLTVEEEIERFQKQIWMQLQAELYFLHEGSNLQQISHHI